MKKTEFIMCPPDYFAIDYQINPWMEPNIWFGRERYLRLATRPIWNQLKQVLSTYGYVREVPAVKGLPDMCFAANGGFMMNGKVLLSNFKAMQRQKEEPYWRNAWYDIGFEPYTAKDCYEGAGDTKWDAYHDCIWMGHGFRSAPLAAVALAETFKKEIICLRLVDARYYHLDLAFCPLERGYLVWYPPAFDDESRKIVDTIFPKAKRYEITDFQMPQMPCNMISIENDIIMSYCDWNLKNKLEWNGFNVIEIPMDPFHFAGGSAACLTLQAFYEDI